MRKDRLEALLPKRFVRVFTLIKKLCNDSKHLAAKIYHHLKSLFVSLNILKQKVS